MGEIEVPNQQVKVDNWPLFFLQRLHHFYRKKSHCDLTLLFSTLDTVKSVKVHKLVLHACTDYFESLDVMKDSEHGEVLQLSNEMHPDVVIPIISFMYTGKLEFPVTLQPKLYEAATKLRMTILTKLLDVQPKKSFQKIVSHSSENNAPKASNVQNDVSAISPNSSGSNQSVQDNLGSSSIDVSITQTNYSSSQSLSKQIEEPIVTLMPVSVTTSQPNQSSKAGVTYIQCADVAKTNQIKPKIIRKDIGVHLTPLGTKAKVIDVSLPPTLPGRKLPVWKRKVPLTGSQFLSENAQNLRSTFRPVEKPKPTRFEWEEDLNDPTTLKPVEDALKILSHDSSIKVTHPIILDPDGTTQQKETSDDSLKKSSDGSSSESPPYKKSRQSDLQDMKEYGKQQQLRNEIICSEENADDIMDADDLYGPCEDDPDEIETFNMTNANSSTPKPILKTVSKPEPPAASKRVRFSLEGKENNQQPNENSSDFITTAAKAATTTASAITTSTKQSESAVTKQKIVLPMNVSQIQSGKHHVKIVSEVLKKYPNLAKRDNIKLRVVSKNPAGVPPKVQQAVEGDGNKSTSSLVSYIFLTNKGSGELIPIRSDSNEKEKLFDVENKTGPWLCQVCDPEKPLEFDSYYTYRRHLVEVHELKIDARICEYCGLKNSKRNHLLYHLYTKHGIDPPAHVSFPKCSECDYIALSDALLVKHKSSHDLKGLTCYTCNVVFKSFSSMQVHLQSSWHKNKLNEVSVIVLSDYPCPFCDSRFENGNDLKEHMESNHHSQREGKQIYRCPYCEALFGDGEKLGKHIVSLHWGKNNQVPNRGTKEETIKPQSGQQLQYTEDAESSVTVEGSQNPPPSSEMDSLNNVASGIATSLNMVGNEQTVVYYEQRTDGQDIGREATVISGNECKEYIISTPVEELGVRSFKKEAEELEVISLDNEDSNSRTSNAEEINRSSCSDHDYSEPQGEEHLRQMIPVHAVSNQLSENTVIQQIIPDQRLVFSNPANVVFQSPCVSLPPRVLLTSGKVVLPRIPHGEQNLILSQVIPQTPIILSSPIIQQSANIIEDGARTIVFANAEATEHLENMQTAVQFALQNPDGVEDNEDKDVVEIVNSVNSHEMCEQIQEGDDESQDKVSEEEEAEEEDEEEVEEGEPEEAVEGDGDVVADRDIVQKEGERDIEEVKAEGTEGGGKGGGGAEEGQEDEDEERDAEDCQNPERSGTNQDADVVVIVDSETSSSAPNPKVQNRVETSKIVDDWDETNDSQQNIECRRDGPSRPDFL